MVRFDKTFIILVRLVVMPKTLKKIISFFTTFSLLLFSTIPYLSKPAFALPTITWDSHNLSGGAEAVIALGRKAFFIENRDGLPGAKLEIYDTSTDNWSLINYVGDLRHEFAATSVGSKMLVGGGNASMPFPIVFNSVDIYDDLTGRWDQAYLNTSRSQLAATTVGCKALFAGGVFSPTTFSTVDIYDSIQDNWSVSNLSTPRYGLAATSAYGKAYFAGGYRSNPPELRGISNRVDIYDSASNSWSTAFLSVGRMDMGATSVGNKVMFAGGETGNGRSNVVDIYDTVTNTWSVSYLTSPFPTDVSTGNSVVATTVGDLAFFWVESSEYVDIYDATTGIWSFEHRGSGIRSGAAGVGNKAFFVNGTIAEIAKVSPTPPVEENTIPVVNLGPNSILNKKLSGFGSIQDGDSCNWLVKVDYGDGSGLQELNRNGYNFTLDHQYYNEGEYTVAVVVTDDHHNEVTTTFTVVALNTPPVVGEIVTGSADPLSVGSVVLASATFSDVDTEDTHSAVWDWGDVSNSTGLVTESNGNGSIAGSHTYMIPGVYTVILTVADNDGASNTATYEFVVIYDPNGGSVRGSGEIESPLGALSWNLGITGGARFGFRSIYQHGANTPSGNTHFTFRVADFKFVSTSYDWLVVAGAKAQYKGSGEINRQGDYGFMLTGIDGTRPGGGGVDKFRIKIWDKTNGDIIYDNQRGDSDTSDPSTFLTRGSIRISE